MKKTLETAGRALTGALLDVLGNPGILVFLCFTVTGMFTVGSLNGYRGLIELQVIVPWGIALALLFLERRRPQGKMRWDLCALLVLLLWQIAPFMLRFGATAANVSTWQSYIILFFGIYALTVNEEPVRRNRQLNAALALFAAVSFVFGGALLYCAATVQNFPFSEYPQEFGFGVYQNAQLCSNAHYNTTGMLAMNAAFLCLCGFFRAGKKGVRLLYLVPAVMMMLVTVLTQSRTARYSLLAGLAVGCYGMIAVGGLSKKAWIRHAAGLLAGAVVLVGGFLISDGITDAALRHYARGGQQTVSLVAKAAAEQETEQAAQQPQEAQAAQARGAGEASFSGRTVLWKNILTMWKNNPKYFLIGNGVGNTNRDILIGTPLEHGGALLAHNAFIQFTIDFGLIGLLLMGAFLLSVLVPVLRVFFCRAGAVPGMHALCMLVVGCLLTGMMENDPLIALRPCCVVFFYALAQIVAAQRDRGISCHDR